MTDTLRDFLKIHTDHLAIAAKTWARNEVRTIKRPRSGISAEEMEEWLCGWLADKLIEFTNVYYRDMEERLEAMNRLVNEYINQKLPVFIKASDTRDGEDL